MDNRYTEPYERIIAYRYYLNTHDDTTLKNLSSGTSIPYEVVKNDLRILTGGTIPIILADPIDEDDEELFDKGFDDYCEKAVFYSNEELDYTSDDSYLLVHATIDEYIAFNNIFEQSGSKKRVEDEKYFITSTIRNKKYVHEFDAKIIGYLYSIESAIISGSCISFRYSYGFNQEYDSICMIPAKIAFDATESKYAVLTTDSSKVYVYDLELIDGDISISKAIVPKPDLKLLSRYNKVWGFDFNSALNNKGEFIKPTRVKVIFYDEANVINKAKRDLTYRNPISLSVDKNGNLVYEDDIYGIDAFLRWIYSFGSSVQILEPKCLIDRVIKEISSRLENI